MKDRPLIGINTDYRAAVKGRAPQTMVHSGYYDSILSAGAIPILLPPLTKEQDLGPILDRLDGVLLTGGDDLDPKKMNLGFHPSVTMMNERRENSDRLLCRLVQERKLPVLAIGVGMQELNVCNGGGIYLHLPEDLPKAIPHRDPQGGPHRHTVVMEPGTRMEEIYGPGEIRVNSYHHQGIRKLAPNFVVAALAPDGLVEAYEGRDPGWWVVGVQWHPENEGTISLDTQLIESFVAASSNSHASPKLAKVG
ncbi:gamma-glutamyl-gamma-aminobutyrate hydrolase family protein [Isosphaeraceae bacterium EP7]